MKKMNLNHVISFAIVIVLIASCTKMDTGNLDHREAPEASYKTDETQSFSDQIEVSDKGCKIRIKPDTYSG